MVAENMRTQDRLDNLLPEIIEWRRDIHQHPELGYEVHRTAALVAEKLKEFGCDHWFACRYGCFADHRGVRR